MLRVDGKYSKKLVFLGDFRHLSFMLSPWIRKYVTARPARQAKSHIKTKLDHFVETGEVRRLTPTQEERKGRFRAQNIKRLAAKSRPSASKVLLLLKAKYDNTLLTSKNTDIDLQKLKPQDLYVDSTKLLDIFQSLMEVKKVTRKPIDEKIMLTLLGSSPEQLKDPFLVTKDVLKLLERDNDTARAMQLCLMAKENGEVGMNAILQWSLDRGDVEQATKSLMRRKKWGIPANEHTYIHYFSGLAKCHEWGNVPDDLANKCEDMFTKIDFKPSVEIFNACLSLLVKNFSQNQKRAWDFFDQLETLRIPPTCQTYTIFLNGCKKYHQSECQLIRKDMSINASQRTTQLFQAQAKLISTAKMVLERLKKAAIPPIPPTREEADANPKLLENYRKKIRQTLMDIDPVFAATFVLCYINNYAGTTYSASQGSHYVYLQQGLAYLQMWCPEVESMLYFVLKLVNTKHDSDSSVYFTSDVSSEVQRRTEARLEHAHLQPESNPLSLCAPLLKDQVNPLVIFPPPAFSSKKTKAIFSGKQKRLVDFGRPTFADIEKLVAHRNYVSSKGKYGKKLPAMKPISLDRKSTINKFLLLLALDALIKLGLHKEFYLAMWYALTKWGGLYLSRTGLLEKTRDKLTCGALPPSEYPVMKKPEQPEEGITGKKNVVEAVEPEQEKMEKTDSTEQTDVGQATLSFHEKLRLTPTHDEKIIDALLVENFIYKIEENFNHSDVPVRYAVELVAAMVSESTNISKSLVPRDKTFDYIFSILNRDVHLYNDKNVHKGAVANRRKGIRDNTAKRSLTAQQLRDLLDPLLVLIDSIMVHEGRVYSKSQNRKSLMLNRFVESYNSLIKTLYGITWSDAPENGAIAVELHKKILHSGILFYRPKTLIDPRDKIVYTEIVEHSMEYVYKHLKANSQLDSKDKKLMLTLRSLFQLDASSSEALESLNSLQWKIYHLST